MLKYVFCPIFLLCGTLAVAQTSRGAFVEELSNEQSSFAVRVDVDRNDRVYAKDDLLRATVESNEDGYLYFFYRDAEGNVAVLFPNRLQKDNFIRKNETVTVPASNGRFKIRIDAPFGDELLKAVVSKKPLQYIDNTIFAVADVTPVGEGTMKNFAKSYEKNVADWAEHQVGIKTVASRSDSPPSLSPEGGRRFAVCIGISDYRDGNIGKLGICHVDAEKMLELFTRSCGVKKENTFLLANENATLSNIRRLVKDELSRKTKPGDTVFLFWSGHGGRTADGKREFLIPYDASGENVEGTMLMDETFGRWIQELDGRKVLIILDACNSGGQANNAKGGGTEWQPLRFAFTRLAMAKDIGQKDTALIASSTASEVSFVRKERDLSVLTYFVLQAITESADPMTHVKLVETVKPQVSGYVQRHFTDKNQTVVMQDDLTEPLVLNP